MYAYVYVYVYVSDLFDYNEESVVCNKRERKIRLPGIKKCEL